MKRRRNVIFMAGTVGLCIVCKLLDTSPTEAVLGTALLGYWIYNDEPEKKEKVRLEDKEA